MATAQGPLTITLPNPTTTQRIFPALGCYIAEYIGGGLTGHARDWHFTHGSGTSRIPDHEGRPFLAGSTIQLSRPDPDERFNERARVTTLDTSEDANGVYPAGMIMRQGTQDR